MWSNTLTERRSKAGEEKSIIVDVGKRAIMMSTLCLVCEAKK
jgi:hypothetical protein